MPSYRINIRGALTVHGAFADAIQRVMDMSAALERCGALSDVNIMAVGEEAAEPKPAPAPIATPPAKVDTSAATEAIVRTVAGHAEQAAPVEMSLDERAALVEEAKRLGILKRDRGLSIEELRQRVVNARQTIQPATSASPAAKPAPAKPSVDDLDMDLTTSAPASKGVAALEDDDDEPTDEELERMSEPAPMVLVEPPPAPAGATLDDVRKVMQHCMTKMANGRDAVKAVLAKFGAANASSLKAEQLGAVKAALEEVLRGAK